MKEAGQREGKKCIERRTEVRRKEKTLRKDERGRAGGKKSRRWRK